MKHTGGTEDASSHDELEQRSSIDLLQRINQEDQKIAQLVADALPAIEAVVDAAHHALDGGLGAARLFDRVATDLALRPARHAATPNAGRRALSSTDR